jgi:hypothetical protein
MPIATITFMDIVRDLSSGAKYYFQILDVGQDIEKYIKVGKDPADALDFLLGFYQTVPHVQEEIRSVIIRALDRYKDR